MMQGRLIAVVGPSGVGKDSVMAGICDAMPGLHLVRRVITRAQDAGGEDFTAVTTDEFEAMAKSGVFAVQWGAHGLRYGIPISVKYQLSKGTDCLANFSRSALAEAAGTFSRLVVLNLTAQPETLAHRLNLRRREGPRDIARRLAQAEKALPPGLETITLSNDGPLSQTVARAVARLHPMGVSL